nr:MAG TPA: hypothetical protein [Caudoviricetes sp.]
MKRYKLLKDTPTLKAGTIFEERESSDGYKELGQVVTDGCLTRPWLTASEINNFDDWFEEIPEYKRRRAEIGDLYYFIDDSGNVTYKYDYDNLWDNYRHSTGNYGLVKKDLETKREYDIARQVLLDDAEGGKWKKDEKKYFAHYDEEWSFDYIMYYVPGVIYFRDEESVEKSLKKHKDQWEIVRKYEMDEL